MPGITLLAELRRRGVDLPVVFLTGKVIASDERDRCLLAPRETLDASERMAFGHGCDKLVLKPEIRRASWNGVDVDLTLGEYKLIHLLASHAGSVVTYRAIYNRLRHEGFIAGDGQEGIKAAIRSAIKCIRNKFRARDSGFDEIENYTGFGYGWHTPD